MMFTTEMIQLFAVVLAKDCEPVTETLLREGVMQFINISELESEKPESLSEIKSDISLTKISDLRKRIEGFLFAGGVIPPAPKETDLNSRTAVNIKKENERVDYFGGVFQSNGVGRNSTLASSFYKSISSRRSKLG